MALNEDERRRPDELDRTLSEAIDGYEVPTEGELEQWRTEAPHPSDAVDYGAAEADGEADS